MRKVAGGGTAGGDRWEGEDEDEDVKVGAGLGARLRGWAPAAGGETRGPRAPPGPAGRGSRVSVGPEVPWFSRLDGHVGSRRQPVRPDSAEGGGRLGPSPSPSVHSGLEPNWRREVTAAVRSAHVLSSQSRTSHRNKANRSGARFLCLSHMESRETRLS